MGQLPALVLGWWDNCWEIHDQFLCDCGGFGTLLGVFLVRFWAFLNVFGCFLGFENIVGGAQSVVENIVGGAQSVVNGTQKKGGPYVLQLGVTRISGPY